jgi:parallel beta helix pectate lyase-like protein
VLAVPLHASAAVACGATISVDTTLTASDPVVFDPASPGDKPCPSSGLSVKGGVTLDCDGLIIKGKGVGTGIAVLTGDSAFIQNCVVDSFNVGIQLGGRGSHTVQNVRVMNSKTNGVVIAGGQNSLGQVVSQKNGGVGFLIRGDGNQIGQTNLAIDNKKGGFTFTGNGQFVDTNYAINNGAAGFSGTGRGSSFSGNIAVGNKGAGLTYGGGSVALPNDVGGTAAFANAGDGIVVTGTVDTALDDGGNIGEANAGATQCRIAGAPCQ